jgi:hypothetical protein
METTAMSAQFIIALNLMRKAPSQYIDQSFDSVVEFNGQTVYFGPAGIFEESGDTDNGSEITSWVDTPTHDFGNREQKSIEAFDVGYESAGELDVVLYADEDEDNAREFVLSPAKFGQVQQDGMQTLRKHRHGKARYWKVRITNRGGCDFSLDHLSLAPVFLKRRGR